MRTLAVPVLAAFALAALPAHATLPASDPRCGLPALSAPDPDALAGNGYVRLAADGTASWLLPDAYVAAWTPDAGRVAYWTRPRERGLPNVLCVADGDGSRARHVFTGSAWGGLVWSPDGATLAFAGTEWLATEPSVRVGTASGTTVVASGAHLLAWSPDGTALATGGATGADVRALDGTVTTVLDTEYASALAWAGDRVAYVLGSDVSGRLVTAHGDGTGRAELGNGVRTFALAPDASRVAYSDSDGLAVAAADGTGVVHVDDDGAYSPAWSPDSTTLAYGANDGGYTLPAAGSPATRITTGETTWAGWTSATEPWFGVMDGANRWVETGGGRLATAAEAHGLTVARRAADGSYVLHVTSLTGPSHPRVG